MRRKTRAQAEARWLSARLYLPLTHSLTHSHVYSVSIVSHTRSHWEPRRANEKQALRGKEAAQVGSTKRHKRGGRFFNPSNYSFTSWVGAWEEKNKIWCRNCVHTTGVVLPVERSDGKAKTVRQNTHIYIKSQQASASSNKVHTSLCSFSPSKVYIPGCIIYFASLPSDRLWLKRQLKAYSVTRASI